MKNEAGATFLYLACEYNQEALIEILLRADADPNIRTISGAVPLHENRKIVEDLLEAGADPNIPNSDGNYPLHLAVRKDRPDIVTDLLDANANPFAKNHNGRTPRDVAILNNRFDIHDILQQAEEDAEENWEAVSLCVSKEPGTN